MSGNWLFRSWSDLWPVPIAAIGMLAVIILVVRLIGLRSFSKMSSFDFAVTVSVGSILGAVATSSTALTNGALAVATLLGAQAVVSFSRIRRPIVEETVDNTPILLMDGAQFLDANLRHARVARSDVLAKLRAANVASLDDVRAVVLETTGDISVIHGHGPIDPAVLDGVRRGPTLDRPGPARGDGGRAPTTG